MGQRHQLFVIAKIRGRYRSLCAIHHQWLYGQTALRRCLDTLNIFGDPSNRMPLQEELLAASKKDEEFWLAAEDEDEPYIPFPFITTCLTLGASFNTSGYYHGTMLEPFTMAYNEGDNNNGQDSSYSVMIAGIFETRLTLFLTGITIFDITDLHNIRYCFVDYIGMESDREVELMTPLSARTYLEAYYELDKPEHKADLLPLVGKFEQRDVISTAVLKATWPRGEWQGDEVAQEDDSPPEELERTKTLRDRSMETVLGGLLSECRGNSQENPQDHSELLAEMELMTDFVPKLRKRLYEEAADLTASDVVLSLLKKSLEQEIEVDLAPFQHFPADHLAALVATLRCGNMRVLSLSNLPNLTETDLSLILGNNSGIKGTDQLGAIVLMETPTISAEFVSKNLDLYEVYHSELFRRPFTLEQSRRTSYEDPHVSTLPFANPNLISQIVWIGVTEMQTTDSKFRLANGGMDWSGLKYSEKAANHFSHHSVPKYQNFLVDLPFTPGKTIHGLQRLLQYLTSPTLNWLDSWPKAAACCFATTSPNIVGSCSAVGPLSPTLSVYDEWNHEMAIGKGISLQAGQWAITLIHEGFDARDLRKLRNNEEVPAEDTAAKSKPLKRLRYALVRKAKGEDSSEKPYLVTDVPGYLEKALASETIAAQELEELKDWWQQNMSTANEAIDYYKDADIHDILQKVYPSEPSDQDTEPSAERSDPLEPIMKLMSLAQRGDA